MYNTTPPSHTPPASCFCLPAALEGSCCPRQSTYTLHTSILLLREYRWVTAAALDLLQPACLLKPRQACSQTLVAGGLMGNLCACSHTSPAQVSSSRWVLSSSLQVQAAGPAHLAHPAHAAVCPHGQSASSGHPQTEASCQQSCGLHPEAAAWEHHRCPAQLVLTEPGTAGVLKGLGGCGQLLRRCCFGCTGRGADWCAPQRSAL